jgi:hypothetical protein
VQRQDPKQFAELAFAEVVEQEVLVTRTGEELAVLDEGQAPQWARLVQLEV